MSAAAIRRQFEERAGAPDATRTAALEKFEELGFPDRRLETWHYTDLTPLADRDFRFLTSPPDAGQIDAATARLADMQLPAGHGRLVFIDGYWIESLSMLPQNSGVDVSTRDVPVTDPGNASALTALNTAFAAEGSTLRFRETDTNPVELIFVGTGRQLAPQFRLRIELAANVKATVVQHFVDLPDAGPSWLNLVTDVVQADASELALYRLQSHGAETLHTTLNRVHLESGARFSAGNIELGAALARNEFEVSLDGVEADARIFGLAITRDQQHCDLRIAVDHRAPRTTSRQDYRAIVDDKSRSIFNGKVVVRKDAQNIDARQRNDNLLLSKTAEVDTKPELEIYADQVVCSHGATIGELDEDHLFYLRSRGLDAETARGILTTAFAETILERIGPDDLREQARPAVHASLPRIQ